MAKHKTFPETLWESVERNKQNEQKQNEQKQEVIALAGYALFLGRWDQDELADICKLSLDDLIPDGIKMEDAQDAAIRASNKIFMRSKKLYTILKRVAASHCD